MLCECGCGATTSEGRRFRHGHWARRKDRVRPPEDRFWEHVDKTGSCWLWTAYRNPKGYGVFGLTSRKLVLAHRFAWTIEYGEIPDGLGVCHTCDTPACVNHAHLFLGDQAANMGDASQKGRFPVRHGSHAARSKLTQEDVREIRARYVARKVSAPMLAREFGTSPSNIMLIVNRRTWTHI
jgi:hypothetical protein